MTVDEEKRIIERVCDGDSNAFEELVLYNQRNVYNLALKITRNEEDALDLSQEAFIKAYRQLGSFRGECKFAVWLYRLTYNLCIDFLRKKRIETTSLEFESEDGDIRPQEIPDFRNLPENSVLRKELRKSIADSINELPQKHREILVMREITCMSYEEISETIGISTGTVKSRIARARQKLLSIMRNNGTFPDGYRHIIHNGL